MNKTIGTLIAAGVALALSGGAFAQGNNTLATPSTKSPADMSSSGYGTPGATTSESGTGWQDSGQSNGANMGSTSAMPANGVNNTLATPSTKSPAGQ
ncbi:hypothetical protein C0Z18_24405 [Trinickia dabaoshanensis]|uniref:Proteophosphoglycan ppg4 n=1 Tax=Trinickia dabaoshanensis TaxID=564714 RepID=A0A2N7VG55_9BURK|nr:hypothetical protein [Trinickia dabaoshanensis]PMS16138.1 hypothetical protein C0Z18_24405 [Trinickia dabaoshanensis]